MTLQQSELPYQDHENLRVSLYYDGQLISEYDVDRHECLATSQLYKNISISMWIIYLNRIYLRYRNICYADCIWYMQNIM